MPIRLRKGLAMRRAAAVLILAAVLGAATACGSAGPSVPPVSAVTTVSVGVVPVVDVAPLYLGIKKGFFTRQKLTVVARQVQQGSAIITQVVSGGLDIGFSNNVSLIAAASRGIPLRIVAAGNQAGPGLYSAIFVRKDSPITTPRDLAGKRIAVNAVENVGPLVVNAALQSRGVSVAGISYVAVPFPNMASALARSQVDAVWAVEPFSGAISAQGDARLLLEPYPLLPKNFPVASYFVSAAYRSAHADVVSRFTRAMNESLTYAQAHPAEVRQLLPTFIKIAPRVAATVALPRWSTDIEAGLLATTASLATRYGFVSATPNISQLTRG
jgi:NitT/TauT family transport system substrate-binding protein